MKDVLVGLREDQEQELRQLAQRRGKSRSALIRDAVDRLLADDRLLAEDRRKAIDEAFGLWGDRTGDGLAYQRAIRDEW